MNNNDDNKIRIIIIGAQKRVINMGKWMGMYIQTICTSPYTHKSILGTLDKEVGNS